MIMTNYHIKMIFSFIKENKRVETVLSAVDRDDMCMYVYLFYPICGIWVICCVIANKKMSHLTRLINLKKLNGFKLNINLSLCARDIHILSTTMCTLIVILVCVCVCVCACTRVISSRTPVNVCVILCYALKYMTAIFSMTTYCYRPISMLFRHKSNTLNLYSPKIVCHRLCSSI